MNKSSPYGQSFFQGRVARVIKSAAIMGTCINDYFHPKSVVDVGCGDGAFLAEWAKMGVDDYIGIDGEWINPSVLKIPLEKFITHDLNRPIQLSRTYDICTSFEVAEHLEPSSAEDFVRSLTQLSNVVVFSAAIPGQGGTGHINEQWQDYWQAHFKNFNFESFDCIRPQVWEEIEVEPCYLQNTLVYIHRDTVSQWPDIAERCWHDRGSLVRRIHPRLWQAKIEESKDLARFGLVALVKALPTAVSASVKSRLPGQNR